VNVTVDAPPTVTLTAPANNAIFAEPASVSLSSTASDAVGNVTKVDFYQGTTLIGTATAAPYTFAWTSVPAGNYSLTAVATNDGGGTSTSAPIAIKVDAAPSVTLDTPANNAVFATSASIGLSATAGDTVGSIAKVDFYQGTILIGTATASPFTFNWTGVAAGTYSLTAVATNDAGTMTASSAVAITVDAAPSISISSPSDGSSFTAPANIAVAVTVGDTVGTVTKVDFYQGGTLITTATAAPFGFTWTNVPVGNYGLTAVATNDAGETTTSAAVSITVKSGVAQVYYIETDHLNSPRRVYDQSQNLVWAWDNTEPFGDSVPNGDPNNTGNVFELNLRLPGQYFDRETGLFYNYFRDFAPNLGRYDQSDPLGLRGSLNTYAYVQGDPIEYADPRGLFGEWPDPSGPPAAPSGNAWTAPEEFPPCDCVDPVTITTNGVCRDGDMLCAQAMQAAGIQPPYFPTTATYSRYCLVSFGVGVKGTLFAAGTVAQKFGPGIVGSVFGEAAGSAAARVAAAAGSGPGVVISAGLSIAAVLEHCECKTTKH
jgi:RHS repeat-associated protein